jgi:NAD(P)-dependent dehydrogenase (short-subunit alcohol dehydrogenase family)
MPGFAGKVAIVTGAAQGIGAAYSLLLAREGCRVVLADINEDGARATAEKIAAETGTDTFAIRVDVADPDQCRACATLTEERFGRVDYLVNNAGLLSAGRAGPLHTLEPETYLRIFAVMTHGMLFMAQAVTTAMKAGGGGAIVNTSSIGAWMATGIYSLTKLGVNGLTVSLARELLPFGIRVNAVAPGATSTEGLRGIMTEEQMGRWVQSLGKSTDEVAAPEDIARTGLFLLSDAASHVSGQIIAVDQGALVRV